jgi:CRISPR-associated endonuclease/helicase Cas3
VKYYAHSKEGAPPEEWQLLQDHLENVANLAAEFAEPFGGADWARIAGRHHDLGKGTRPWQAWLRKVNNIADAFAEYYDGHPKHAALGAKYLHDASQQAGKLLAYCVAGHHAGLPDWDGDATSGLKTQLDETYPSIRIPLRSLNMPNTLPVPHESGRFGYSLQFFTRMLFSCLVDADYLDTEEFLDKKRSEQRSVYPQMRTLYVDFWKNFNLLRDAADSANLVNQQREQVLKDCLASAKKKPGLFSLTVPTGGGKTLASLAFALEHAKKYKKRRIIYVIPFTSIIEQNAAVFRKMLGEDVVLEHHCNFIPDETDWQTRLAAENWDARVVVTTNVQFFNSFYANKTSKCRKLHNIANSVVIFDEVQTIPVEKLRPCLEVIRELSLNYGVTSILCTATQPAIGFSEYFPVGLKGVREIVQDVTSLFEILKRTEEKFIGVLNEEEVASRLSEQKQVLCIVNTRQQALDVFNALPESDENIHLSALMYPAHRTRKLNTIRKRLEAGKLCRVVSTQLIEAGVDVDFPCVFRVVAGIDSIAQAAGRCNRNGLSETPGKVSVFEFSEKTSCSLFKQAAQSARKLFGQFQGHLTDPECVRAYFDDYFWKNEERMDEDGTVQTCLRGQSGSIQFKDIAQFEMIKSATIPIVIALEEPAQKLVQTLKSVEYKRTILRRLQQYTVQIYPHQFREMGPWLENPTPGVFVLTSEERYSEKTGLQCEAPEGQAFFG